MSARDVIAEEIEPAVGVYAPELADAIIARLEASGRSIVHKDEIHAPSVERAIAVASNWRRKKIGIKDRVFDPCGRWDTTYEYEQGRERDLIVAALRELMKEVDRG